MRANLHYILCQSTNEDEFIKGPLYTNVLNGYIGGGVIVPYYYHKDKKHPCSKFEIIKLCAKAVFSSKKHDLLLLWGPGSFYLYFLNGLFFFRRKVMFMNLIFNPDNIHRSLKKRLSFFLYRNMFKSGRYMANVNAPELAKMYADLFCCSKDCFPVVYDSMEISSQLRSLGECQKNEFYVFFGGRAERDVECMARIAKQMPNVKFVCVIGTNMLIPTLQNLPNVEIYIDIPQDDFNMKLAHSSLCCIPLKSKAPCGLLVMQRAALLGIPIVSTETYSMRTIIPSDDYGFLCAQGDDKAMVDKLTLLMNDANLYHKVAANAKEHMKQFTKEEVGKQICQAVNYMLARQ